MLEELKPFSAFSPLFVICRRFSITHIVLVAKKCDEIISAAKDSLTLFSVRCKIPREDLYGTAGMNSIIANS